jgi:ComF family protein
VDRFFGQTCFLCALPSEGALLCQGCRKELPWLPAAHCPVCAQATPTPNTCGDCLAHPPHFDATIALFEYRFPMDALIAAGKYRAHFPALAYLATHLAQGPAPESADCLIPMPLHPRRLAHRGFNQAIEIARHLAQPWQLPIKINTCERDVDTPPQTLLAASARRANPSGAFRCTESLSGLHVLVIDDVMTTGSTLNELARVLKAQGARRVTNCVIARTSLPPGRHHV